MHKYQPRIHLARLKHKSDQQQTAQPPAETLSDIHLTSDFVMTFVFTETMFTAVTAYQNQLVNISTHRRLQMVVRPAFSKPRPRPVIIEAKTRPGHWSSRSLQVTIETKTSGPRPFRGQTFSSGRPRIFLLSSCFRARDELDDPIPACI